MQRTVIAIALLVGGAITGLGASAFAQQAGDPPEGTAPAQLRAFLASTVIFKDCFT